MAPGKEDPMKRILCSLLLASLPFGSVLADAPKSKNAKVTLVYQHELPNVPGKSIKGVLVEYGPGGYSPAHTHAKLLHATIATSCAGGCQSFKRRRRPSDDGIVNGRRTRTPPAVPISMAAIARFLRPCGKIHKPLRLAYSSPEPSYLVLRYPSQSAQRMFESNRPCCAFRLTTRSETRDSTHGST
jgi:hypothetical protein